MLDADVMDFALTLKKTLTLLALVDPLLAIPLFISATSGLDMASKQHFSRQLGVTVAVSLLAGGLFGLHFLSFMGVSLAAIQVGGGAVVFVVAVAMVIAKEETVKYTEAESAQAALEPSIVPLGVPLLAGPAALSYVMATSHIERWQDLLYVILPPVLVGIATWLSFRIASRSGRLLSGATLKVVERLAGFLLTAIAVEMMAAGLKSLFPSMAG